MPVITDAHGKIPKGLLMMFEKVEICWRSRREHWEESWMLHTYIYTHLLIHAEIYIYMLYTCRLNDYRRSNKGCKEKYSPLTLLPDFERVIQRFACERMLETEHKLHILTPLLWPSRCVFSCSPDVGVYSIGAFRGPPRSGVAFPTTSGLWLSGILLATALGPKLNWVK